MTGSGSLESDGNPSVTRQIDVVCQNKIIIGVGFAGNSAVYIRSEKSQLFCRSYFIRVVFGSAAAIKGACGIICPYAVNLLGERTGGKYGSDHTENQ